jgi:hypothetical protein
MKARDLAALAALGIAGKYAFDKFGNKKKDATAKTPAAKKEAEQEAYDYDTPAQKAELGTKGAYLPETAELRTKGAYLDDTPEFRTKGAYLDERATPAVEAKPVAKPVAKAAVSRSVAAAPAAAATPAADVVADDYVMPRTAPKPVMPDAKRVTPYNSDIMYNTTIPFDEDRQERQNRFPEAITAETEQTYARMLRQGTPIPRTMNRLAEERMERQGTKPAQMPNDAAAARIARQSTQSGEAAAIAAAKAAAAEKQRLRQVANAQAQARLLRQGAGRAKGGAVRMASGGMASSKMSKPSGASRGDGIAQRGRTRGTLR